MSAAPPRVSLSIVSHGHGGMLPRLLEDLRGLAWPSGSFELLLTFNIPEDDAFLARFQDLPLQVVRNTRPAGFGANHNAAFRRSAGSCFAVVTPDIRLRSIDLDAWTAPLLDGRVGACAPLARDSQGVLQDNARRFPTWGQLARRAFTGRREPGYAWQDGLQQIDWAAAYWLLVRREAFQSVGGFDESYFMYMEDVDLCERLWRHGWQVVWDPSIDVVHDSQRASHRELRHLAWHLRSAARFLWRRRVR